MTTNASLWLVKVEHSFYPMFREICEEYKIDDHLVIVDVRRPHRYLFPAYCLFLPSDDMIIIKLTYPEIDLVLLPDIFIKDINKILRLYDQMEQSRGLATDLAKTRQRLIDHRIIFARKLGEAISNIKPEWGLIR